MVKPSKWFGVVADFGGYYGSFLGGINVHVQSYLFGPQVSVPGRFSPFVHVLAGVASESLSVAGPSILVSVSTRAFSSAVGGGIDWKLNRFASIRVVQVDYLLTRFNGQTRNEPRVSSGLVLHF